MSENNAQPQNTLGNQLSNIQEGAMQGAKNITDTLGSVRDNLNTQVKDFSSKTSNFSTKEFLESNTLIAKLVFLILVLIGFMILMYLGIAIIKYFTSTSTNNLYVVNGLNDGSNYKVVPQDPRNSQSVTITRSNNQNSGIEFTWSIWLKTSGANNNKTPYSHIFSKGGNGTFNRNGIMQINNAPGVYFTNGDAISNNSTAPGYKGPTQTNVAIFMNVASTTPTNEITSLTESLVVNGVPIGTWFNMVIRLENKVMDVYINGTLTKRHIFTNVPIQNYDDVYVCANGGFSGTMSDLRYFNRSLNVFEINNIVSAGPKLTYVGGNKDAASQMSYVWYNKNANV